MKSESVKILSNIPSDMVEEAYDIWKKSYQYQRSNGTNSMRNEFEHYFSQWLEEENNNFSEAINNKRSDEVWSSVINMWDMVVGTIRHESTEDEWGLNMEGNNIKHN